MSAGTSCPGLAMPAIGCSGRSEPGLGSPTQTGSKPFGGTLMSRVRLLAATIIVASWAGQVSMAAKATASKPAEAAAPRIAVFRLSGEMREGPPQFDLGLEMEE